MLMYLWVAIGGGLATLEKVNVISYRADEDNAIGATKSQG